MPIKINVPTFLPKKISSCTSINNAILLKDPT